MHTSSSNVTVSFPYMPGMILTSQVECVRVAHSSTRDGAGSVRISRSHCRPCPVSLHLPLPPPLPPPHSLVCPKLRLASTTPQHARQTHRDNTANSQHDNMANTTRQHMNTCSEHNDMITHPAGAWHCSGSSCLCIGRVGACGECNGNMTWLVYLAISIDCKYVKCNLGLGYGGCLTGLEPVTEKEKVCERT
jgi:hypothetical protein